jgi:hypothetical protein
MIFFKGGISLEILQWMPIPEVLEWVERMNNFSNEIKQESDRQIADASKR